MEFCNVSVSKYKVYKFTSIWLSCKTSKIICLRLVTANFTSTSILNSEKRIKAIFPFTVTVLFSPKYTCKNFYCFSVEERVSKSNLFFNSLFSQCGSGGVRRNQFFLSAHPANSTFLWFCFFLFSSLI